MSLKWSPICVIVLTSTFLSTSSGQPDSIKEDLESLKKGNIKTDTPSLMSYFKKRTLSKGISNTVSKLIDELGASEYTVREKATADLVDLEGLARPLLTRALTSADPEIRKRARVILARIGPASEEALYFGPAARVLASRKVAGTAQVLLDFLPSVEEDDVVEEVARALDSVALDKKGMPDPALLLALSDRMPVKRAAAAAALARMLKADNRAQVRKLLKDPDVSVRRRLASALLEARDKSAVPVLIDILTSESTEESAAAEEFLAILAGDKAPLQPDGEVPNARLVYQKSWEAWWKANGDKIDLEKINFMDAARGYTLVTTMSSTRTTTGVVMELDSVGKVRWQIENLNYPVYASMIRRDRVLVCEYYGNRVTERDLKGNIRWSKNVGNQVLCAERLPNGHTFIATRNQLLEVDLAGKEVRTINRPFDVLTAHRHRDGKYTLLTTNGMCLHLDATGKQLSSFSMGFLGGSVGFRAHFLPKGGVVVPDYSRNKIREYDASGKMLWEINANRPSAVVKLPNGHLLYASRIRPRIVELDKTGKELSSREVKGRLLFIDRR